MSLFYEGSKWDIDNLTYHLYMCCGQRSRGKTTVWLNKVTQRAFTDLSKHKFIYIRRAEVDLQLALSTGLFNGVRTVFPEFWDNYGDEYVKDHNLYLRDKEGKSHHVGYTFSLNTIKGISIEDADVLLFDEYIEPTRSRYKGGDHGANEPELFARLLETIFRKRQFWAILLGNLDSNTNPYHEYFHIPYMSNIYKNKGNSLWFEMDISEDTKKEKESSVLGTIFRNTSYIKYSNGEKAMDNVSDDLIAPTPSHAKQYCNVIIYGKKLTIWIDEDRAVEYIADGKKFNKQYPTISVTTSDMSIDTSFFKYNSDFISNQKFMYGRGRVRFNTQEVASLYLSMLTIE